MGTRAPEPGRTRLGKSAGPVHNLAPAKIGAPRRQPGTRKFADPHVECVPFSRAQTHKASRGPTSEQTQRRADLPSRGARSAPLPPALPSSTSPAPKPRAASRRAGRGRGGVSGGACPKGGVARRRGQSCERHADCAAEKPCGNPDSEEPLVPARPGQAPRYGVPLGLSLGSVLQSGRC